MNSRAMHPNMRLSMLARLAGASAKAEPGAIRAFLSANPV
jgi:hypothetical protein